MVLNPEEYTKTIRKKDALVFAQSIAQAFSYPLSFGNKGPWVPNLYILLRSIFKRVSCVAQDMSLKVDMSGALWQNHRCSVHDIFIFYPSGPYKKGQKIGL